QGICGRARFGLQSRPSRTRQTMPDEPSAQDDLFLTRPSRPRGPDPSAPLADRMRPDDFSDFVGQDQIIAPGRPLRRAIESDTLSSVILWGPPGSGKTTLARIIARCTKAEFVAFSAVTSGIPELRRIIKAAEQRRGLRRQRTILFVDELHRFNKAQQDAFLPHVERGTIILLGATTENQIGRASCRERVQNAGLAAT